jgi:hypothetical protein
MVKKLFYISCLFLGIIYALVSNSIQEEILIQGSNLPKITFEGTMGKSMIEHELKRKIIIIWFHPDCEHCNYQMRVINDHLDEFKMCKFYFFTDDKSFPAYHHLGRWENLTTNKYVQFGIIDRSKFCSFFGPVVNPSIYIFGVDGRLMKKFYGEVKLKKLLETVDTKVAPEQQNAVANNAIDRGLNENTYE